MTRSRTIEICLVLAALLATGCAKDKGGEAPPGDSAAAAAHEETALEIAAETAIVSARGFVETIGASGTVAARADHLASVAAPVSARVTRVLVGVGQTVAAGETMVELDQAPFQAAVQSADASVTAAQSAFERAQRLVADGIVPRKDLEQATAELARARADLAVARRNAQLSVIKAPIHGVITRITAAMGASVEPTQPLVEIADPTAVDVLLNVTPTDAGRLRVGAVVQLSAGQQIGGETLGVGAIVDVAAMVDTVTRTVAVRVQAPATKRVLRIGETVYADITVGTRAGAISIPLEALVPDGDHFTVFVVDASSIAHVREVEVGARSSTAAEITGGLKAGERVVTHGAYGVEDGAKIVAAAKPDKQ